MTELLERAREAHDHAARSGRGPDGRLLEALRGDERPPARAWRFALELTHHASGDDDAAPRHADLPLEAMAEEASREPLTRALRSLAQLARLRFDAAELERCTQSLATLEREGDATVPLDLELAQGWLAWLRGRAPQRLAEAARLARRSQLPLRLIEAQVLEALATLEAGDVEAATTLARRASRMARSEGIPEGEVLASVALARVRRFQNRPHLTLRILAALLPHAPPVWRPWIEWEASMAGSRARAASDDGAPAARLAELLGALGAERAVEDEARALLRATEGAAPLARDARRTLALLLPRLTEVDPVPVHDDDVRAWRQGATTTTPRGLAALALASPPGELDPSACAHVRAAPGEAARRVPGLAVRLERSLYGARLEAAAPPTQPRTDAGLSVLALAGAPVAVEDYFERVYEYAYEPATHATMLGMHVLRMRARVGDAASVVRDEGHLELVAHAPLLLRDPRCAEPLAPQTLRLLARGGAQGAKALAQQLQVPLRTMQRLLKELLVDEDLVRVQAGRDVVYRVEDTTFSEPTRSRRFGVEAPWLELDRLGP